MSTQTYLIDTNVIIGLEDNHAVQPAFAALLNIAAKHRVGIYVHEAARDDIGRDKDVERRNISLSKLAKFQTVEKVRGLTLTTLLGSFGPLSRPNDIVDATLLHALQIGAADFLVSQDRGLHERARRHSAELGGRVLFVPDAVQLLRTTFEPIEPLVRYVDEVPANTIPLSSPIFYSLREDYQDFDQWWRKCVREHRPCWVIDDNGIVGIIVRKDETAEDTDATIKANKILKICTFKVGPEKRGVKLGELLLKKALWFAQINKYDLAYVTTFKGQVSLIDLLEYYGFRNTSTKPDGELIYEKLFARTKLLPLPEQDVYEADRTNYPRFVTGLSVRAFGVPIKEAYHDILYPDLKDRTQIDLFDEVTLGGGPKSPGNTIRKVYLCRAPSKLGPPGSILFFYKGKSKNPPSQAMTAIGIFEELSVARSTRDLMLMTGGRSVYSATQLNDWRASASKPVKVINYLLVGYIDPAISLTVLQREKIFSAHPPQSIFEIGGTDLVKLLRRANLGFAT